MKIIHESFVPEFRVNIAGKCLFNGIQTTDRIEYIDYLLEFIRKFFVIGEVIYRFDSIDLEKYNKSGFIFSGEKKSIYLKRENLEVAEDFCLGGIEVFGLGIIDVKIKEDVCVKNIHGGKPSFLTTDKISDSTFVIKGWEFNYRHESPYFEIEIDFENDDVGSKTYITISSHISIWDIPEYRDKFASSFRDFLSDDWEIESYVINRDGFISILK